MNINDWLSMESLKEFKHNNEKLAGKLRQSRDGFKNLYKNDVRDDMFIRKYEDSESFEFTKSTQNPVLMTQYMLRWYLSLCDGLLDLVAAKNDRIRVLETAVQEREDRLVAKRRDDKARARERVQLAKENGCTLDQAKAVATYELDAMISETMEIIDYAWGMELKMACSRQTECQQKKEKVANATTIDEIISAF